MLNYNRDDEWEGREYGLDPLPATTVPPLTENELLGALQSVLEAHRRVEYRGVYGLLSTEASEERLVRLRNYWTNRRKWEVEQGERLLKIAKPSKRTKAMRKVYKRKRSRERRVADVQRKNAYLEKRPEGKARAFIKNWRALGHEVNIKAAELASIFRRLPEYKGYPLWRTKWNFRITRIDLNVPYQVGNLEFWHNRSYVPVPDVA